MESAPPSAQEHHNEAFEMDAHSSSSAGSTSGEFNYRARGQTGARQAEGACGRREHSSADQLSGSAASGGPGGPEGPGGPAGRQPASSATASAADEGSDFANTIEFGSTTDEPDEGDGGRAAFCISWQNLDFAVESKWWKLASERKPILSGLSGSFESGQLSAVLGPSGAGKSTLIDCLMGKHARGLAGQTRVRFAGAQPRRPLRVATIPQQDHLLDSLTVSETFMFASRIKNAHLAGEEEAGSGGVAGGSKRQPFDHVANVQRVVQQLHLSGCASVRCGKLSGGQYKRVSIGQELLSRPDVLILDEPTSGLDSTTCYQTMSALRELLESSAYPMAIVATIHQPDIEVFQLFHKAYVLAAGGRAIYEGPTEAIYDTVQTAVELVEARRKQPLWKLASSSHEPADLSPLEAQLLERNANPARLLVSLAASEFGYEIVSAMNELQTRQHLPRALEAPPAPSDAGEQCARAPTFDYLANDPANRQADLDPLLSLAKRSQRRSLRVNLRHLALHTSRSWLTILRDPMLFTVQIALHVFVPLLISYSFQEHRGDACPLVGQLDVVAEAYREGNVLDELNLELRTAFENLGYMFFQIYVIIFAAVCVTSLTYPLVMQVLLKEYRNGWYSLGSYFLGRTLADLPVPTCNVVLAMAISYHLTGQPTSPWMWRFASVSALTVLATLVAQTQGLMFGAMLMNLPQSAVFVAPASTAPLVVVSGFLIRIQSLPRPLQLLSKLSYFTHLLNGFIVSRYGFNKCPCAEDDFLVDASRSVPQQARAIIDIWVETFADEFAAANRTGGALAAPDRQVDLVGKLVDTIARAKTFNHPMSSCADVKPFTMLDYQLADADLKFAFLALALMLVLFRWLTYVVLAWKINSCL